jgi:hypothetical protein
MGAGHLRRRVGTGLGALMSLRWYRGAGCTRAEPRVIGRRINTGTRETGP